MARRSRYPRPSRHTCPTRGDPAIGSRSETDFRRGSTGSQTSTMATTATGHAVIAACPSGRSAEPRRPASRSRCGAPSASAELDTHVAVTLGLVPSSTPALLERERELSELERARRRRARGPRRRSGRCSGLRASARRACSRRARRRAREHGLTVLAARGGELERDFPYGVVRNLLEPTLRGLDARTGGPCSVAPRGSRRRCSAGPPPTCAGAGRLAVRARPRAVLGVREPRGPAAAA